MAGSEPAPRSPQRQLMFVAALAVIVCATYSPALDVFLAGDDFEWLDSSYDVIKDPLSSFELINSMWRPVVKWSFLVDYLIFGTNSIGYRITDLAIHVLNFCLLFLLLDRLLRKRWLAAAGAAAFALSPLHSEAVLWASCRGDTLLLTAWLGAWLVLMVGSSESKWTSAGFWILTGLAAGSKESWVVFPLLSVAFIVWVLDRSPLEALRQTRWLWIALALYLTVFVVLPVVAGDSTPVYYADFSPWPAIVKLCRLVVLFCGLGSVVTTDAAAVVVAGLVAACAVTLAVRQRNNNALWAIAVTAATLALAAPFPGIALRHNYLPLAGFWMTMALLVDPLVFGGSDRATKARSAVIAAMAAAVLIVEGLAVQLEIEDYRRYGDLHREIVDELAPIAPSVARDKPLLFINQGHRQAVEEVAMSVVGIDKTFFVRQDAIWQMVFLPPLVNFLGSGFDQKLRVVSEDEVAAMMAGDVTLLVFTDQGFRIGNGVPEGLVDASAEAGGLPGTIALCRFDSKERLSK